MGKASLDINKILDACRSQGFIVSRTRRGHIRVATASGRPVSMFAGTPGDQRSIKIFLSQCRRAGLIYPPAGKGQV